MKKTLGLFAALAVMFLMSADVYSSDDGTKNSGKVVISYCVYRPDKGICERDIEGVGCYLVDGDCNWIDDQNPPED